MNKDDESMTENDRLMDKQVNFFTDHLSETIQQLTMKCIELDGRADTGAITVSLARTFAASVAALTRELSEEDTKLILHELFGIVEEGVNFHKKDLEKYSATN